MALPRSADEWSATLAEAICPETDTPERGAARQVVAGRHDWDLLTAQIARALAGWLGDDVRLRLEANSEPAERVDRTQRPSGPCQGLLFSSP